MGKKIEIGAPSITFIDANDLVNEHFSAAKFPLKIRLENLMPRNIALPEAGVFLKPLGDKADTSIKTLDELHRLVSSIEQISELNHHALAMTLEGLDGEATTPVKSGKAAKNQAEPVAPVQPASTVELVQPIQPVTA